jgi:hypothetical protein
VDDRPTQWSTRQAAAWAWCFAASLLIVVVMVTVAVDTWRMRLLVLLGYGLVVQAEYHLWAKHRMVAAMDARRRGVPA